MASKENNNLKKSTVSNRTFGLFFTAVFFTASMYFLLYRFDYLFLIFISLSIVTLFSALFYPNPLTPFNRLWFLIGLILGRIISPVILGIIFFILITPTAIFLKIAGRDELNLNRERKETFWVLRESEEIDPQSFKNQF